MRQIVIAFVAACALVGCSPVVEPPPPPPTEETPPGPVFTEKEQAYVDAVYAYLDVWTQIAQNPTGDTWDLIREVTRWPADDHDVELFVIWARDGFHLEGGPTFTPATVQWASVDFEGERYRVFGCYDRSGGFLVDRDGTPVKSQGAESSFGWYEVIQTPEGRFFVTNNDAMEDRTC